MRPGAHFGGEFPGDVPTGEKWQYGELTSFPGKSCLQGVRGDLCAPRLSGRRGGGGRAMAHQSYELSGNGGRRKALSSWFDQRKTVRGG
jgi:hypothetical protein